MGELAVQYVAKDLRVTVWVSWKSILRRDAVFVQDSQTAKVPRHSGPSDASDTRMVPSGVMMHFAFRILHFAFHTRALAWSSGTAPVVQLCDPAKPKHQDRSLDLQPLSSFVWNTMMPS